MKGVISIPAAMVRRGDHVIVGTTRPMRMRVAVVEENFVGRNRTNPATTTVIGFEGGSFLDVPDGNHVDVEARRYHRGAVGAMQAIREGARHGS